MTDSILAQSRPRILALDTATSIVSVALTHEDRIDCEINREANRHTELLIPMIDSVMRAAGLTIKDINAVAFGAGPGAFTGLRAACAAAQGLAWAADLPVIAVGNLHAAASHMQHLNVRGRILVANDARMNECYTAVFDVTDSEIVEVSSAGLVAPSVIGQTIETIGATVVTGSALDVYVDSIEIAQGVTVFKAFETTAEDIARVALEKFKRHEVTTPQLAAPVYVRNRVALTINERNAGEKL